jgi:hypothetical protein
MFRDECATVGCVIERSDDGDPTHYECVRCGDPFTLIEPEAAA